jgi:penicillin-binding protein 2
MFSVAFLVILAQMFNLQVVSDKYRKLAMDNAVYPKIVYPERGIIFDRKGKAILNNAIMYDLMVTPSEVKGIDTLEFCRMMEIDTTEFNRRIVDAIIKNKRPRSKVSKKTCSKSC